MTQEKVCSNCYQNRDNPNKKTLGVFTGETGRYVYCALLDRKFEAKDLCNWCYAAMQAYRHSLLEEERLHMERERK